MSHINDLQRIGGIDDSEETTLRRSKSSQHLLLLILTCPNDAWRHTHQTWTFCRCRSHENHQHHNPLHTCMTQATARGGTLGSATEKANRSTRSNTDDDGATDGRPRIRNGGKQMGIKGRADGKHVGGETRALPPAICSWHP